MDTPYLWITILFTVTAMFFILKAYGNRLLANITEFVFSTHGLVFISIVFVLLSFLFPLYTLVTCLLLTGVFLAIRGPIAFAVVPYWATIATTTLTSLLALPVLYFI